VLDEQATADVAAKVITRFVADPTTNWWWSDLKTEHRTIHYDDNGLVTLRSVIGEGQVVLLVTDESPTVRGAVLGPAAAVCDVVADCPGFEFAVTSPEAEWVVFDTHMNRLVVAGTLPGTER
jgi:hypothetical protein